MAQIQTVHYRHYYGLCEEDNVLIQIEVSPEMEPDATLPDPVDWDDFGLRCPICGDTVTGGYEGADDLTTDDERTKRVQAEYRLQAIRRLVEGWQEDTLVSLSEGITKGACAKEVLAMLGEPTDA